MMIAAIADCSWILPVGVGIGIVAVSWWAGSYDERQRAEAKKNGCICDRDAWFHHVRSDCPHCSPKRGV
jgi:hypothetical protein